MAHVLGRLKQYFWCSVFTTNYDQGANSQAGAYYLKLRYWLFDPEKDAPEAVSGFVLSASTVRFATTRRKALNASVLALTVTSGARDFHGMKITAERNPLRHAQCPGAHPVQVRRGERDLQGRPERQPDLGLYLVIPLHRQ